MPENEILAEIRRTRETIARENEYDVAKLFAHFREVTARLEAEGWKVAAPESAIPPRLEDASCVVREEPPPPSHRNRQRLAPLVKKRHLSASPE